MKKIFTIVAALWISASSWAQIPTNGLKFYYNFDDKTSPYNDTSNNNFKLQQVAMPLSFDVSYENQSNVNSNKNFQGGYLIAPGGGSHFLVDGSESLNGTTGFSVSFWAKIPAATYGNVISKHKNYSTNGFNIGFENSYATFYTNVSGNYIKSNTITTPDTWTHFIGTYDGVNMKLYKDRQLVGILYNVTYNTPNTIPIMIGRDTELNFFKGNLDDIMFYDRALTSEEIILLYTEQKKITTTITKNPNLLFCFLK
jgi:hypothetical protein